MAGSLSSLSDVVQKIQSVPLGGNSFVGVDIGTSTIKVVQIAIRDNVVSIETYGEIAAAPPSSPDAKKMTPVPMKSQSDALADLIHEINALSRRCAIAVPFSETLSNTVEMPKRDPAQMRLLIRADAQKYIPVPVESVMLDWYIVPQEEKNAFDATTTHKPVEAQFQKVMIIAITNETAEKLGEVVKQSALVCEFYEIEMFSTVRACGKSGKAPALVLDLGATTTKAYTVNDRWDALAGRSIPLGGQAITEALMIALSCDFPTAERAKCEHGLSDGGPVAQAITTALSPMWAYIDHVFDEHGKLGNKPIQHIMLSGGGASMPGIIEHIAKKYSLPVDVVHSFEHTTGPMILEKTLREDGPRFAVAVGLALRGIAT